MNLSLISVAPYWGRAASHRNTDQLIIVIGLGHRPYLAPFSCRQFPPFHDPKPLNATKVAFKIITNERMSRLYLYICWFILNYIEKKLYI
jgi:hypothetical protein